MPDAQPPDRLMIDAPVIDLSRHDGGLRPAVGVVSTQVLRANRDPAEPSADLGWTYNHAPMLAWWNGTFYLEYLSDPVSEHVPPGQTLLVTSRDGASWTEPRVVFPPYRVREGVYRNHSSYPLRAGSYAVMHQRMGFYTSSSGRLLILGFYGISTHHTVHPNDGNGIGRVVREIHADGTLGDIFFLRYNVHAGWNERNTDYPLYDRSTDADFVAACDELLGTPVVTMQWWEEDRSTDGFYRVEGERAPSTYRLADARTVAVWKSARAAISTDDGRTWGPVHDIAGMITSGGKAWAERLSDDTYALLYNPSPVGKMRWPLAATTSADGLRFSGLATINSEVPPRRYDGLLKDYGLSYVRGIETTAGTPDDALWVAYSANKEDIWISRVPVPITTQVDDHVDDDFSNGSLSPWNVVRGRWTPVDILDKTDEDGKCLRLQDRDRYAVASAQRVFPKSTAIRVEWRLRAEQRYGARLQIELHDCQGRYPLQLLLDDGGVVSALRHGRYEPIGVYRAGEWVSFSLSVDVPRQRYELVMTDESGQVGARWAQAFVAPVADVERLCFRTGPHWDKPNLHTPMATVDLPDACRPVPGGTFLIDWVRTGDPPE